MHIHGKASHVVILMASYQGADHIGAQLDSIAVQTHRDWSLIVSDDGSSDGTREIVQAFASRFPVDQVRLVNGPRAGATRNFLSLLRNAPQGVALALCDQDDLWLPDKLARALTAVEGAGLVHYAARTIIVDEHLRPLTGSRHFRRPFGLRNALVQACMAGNTSVYNPSAAAVLRQAAGAAEEAGILSHDWWAYQVTAGAGARFVHDPAPALLYRQHPRSEVGRNDTPQALLLRARRLMRGDFGSWMQANLRSLRAIPHLLTDDSRMLVDRCAALPSAPPRQAMVLIRELGLYRQTPAGTAGLLAAALAGRLQSSGVSPAS